MKLILGKQVVAEGVKQENEIYRMLFVTPKRSECNVFEAHVSTVNLKIWQERLGHLNKATLRKMINQIL